MVCVFNWLFTFLSLEDDLRTKEGSIACDFLNREKTLLETFSPSHGCQVNVWLYSTTEPAFNITLENSLGCPLQVVDWAISVERKNGGIFFNPAGFGRVQASDFLTPFPAMQFTGLFHEEGTCMYLGVYDKLAIPKTFYGETNLEIKKIGVEWKSNETSSLSFILKMFHSSCDWQTLAREYRDAFAIHTPWYLKLAAAPRVESALWVNTHWQEDDVLEKQGGAPATVIERIERLRKFLPIEDVNLIFLHWYEWDLLGYADDEYTECSKSVCGFDSHYPEYFPARAGFAEALEQLAQMNVRVIPYINGRIFDTSSDSWGRESEKAACKKFEQQAIYIEDYGNNVQFAVMCPSTDYWQSSISETWSEMRRQWPKLGGIYLDQIAAATPVVCSDPGHDHRGGWTAGYQHLLNRTRNSGELIMTEGNVEQFIGYVDTFLTLTAYSGNLSEVVPAFQMVYGGGMTAGSEFYRSDVESDAFVVKLMKQFLFGTQLGWFSIGKSSQSNSMEVLDLLEDNNQLLSIMKQLVSQRANIADVFAKGQLESCSTEWNCMWALGNRKVAITCNPPFSCEVSDITTEFETVTA